MHWQTPRWCPLRISAHRTGAECMPVRTARQSTLRPSAHCALAHTTHQHTPCTGAFCTDRAPPYNGRLCSRSPGTYCAEHDCTHRTPGLIAPPLVERIIAYDGSRHESVCGAYCSCWHICQRQAGVGEFYRQADSTSRSIRWRILLAGAYAGSHLTPVDSATRTQTRNMRWTLAVCISCVALIVQTLPVSSAWFAHRPTGFC